MPPGLKVYLVYKDAMKDHRPTELQPKNWVELSPTSRAVWEDIARAFKIRE